MTKLAEYIAALPIEEQLAVAREAIEALRRENELLRAKARTIAEMDDALNQLRADNEALKRDLDLCGSAGLRAMEQVERLAAANEALRRTLQEECARINDLRRELQQAREQVLRLNGLIEKQIEELVAAKAKLEECEAAIPDSWLDPLLTGPEAVIGESPYSGVDIERLLQAIAQRFAAIAQDNEP